MQLRKARLATALTLAIAVSGALTACGGDGDETASPPAGSPTVNDADTSATDGDDAGASADDGAASTATAWFLTGEPKESLWGASIDTWNQANPNQSIAYEAYANDAYKEKIRTAVGSGSAPTMILNWGAGGTLQEYVASDKVVDLTGRVDDALSRVLPSVADAGKIDGVQYAVPNADSQPVILYYNKELFEQAGIEVPITWDELLASIPKFKDIGVAPFGIAGQSKWPDLMWLEYLADRVGGPETFNAVVRGEENAWSSPEMLQALTYIQDFVEADGFIDNFASITTDSNADAALLYTGKVAMLLQGSWVYGTVKNEAPDFITSGKLGTFPFPTVPGGKGDIANIAGNTSNYWSVYADSTTTDQDAAVGYLNAESYTDTFVDALIDGGALPPVVGIEDKLAASPDADFLTQAYDLVKNAPNFQLSWDQALGSVAAQELLTNLDQIFLGQITPEQFADNMNATIGQ
ncbi:MAG: extracellular solute-binding protein [Bifidobacteriaceae bacterium]|jgi:raffinose/stachyose/melibiose transport system substrate-binding protein|nr:extracellular solute-binding protein [Bifidobacteriaceae bacterium]